MAAAVLCVGRAESHQLGQSPRRGLEYRLSRCSCHDVPACGLWGGLYGSQPTCPTTAVAVVAVAVVAIALVAIALVVIALVAVVDERVVVLGLEQRVLRVRVGEEALLVLREELHREDDAVELGAVPVLESHGVV